MKVSSKKPSKQRKARYHAKPHQMSKLLVARVGEAIQMEWGIKRLPIRKDDMVRVLSGEFEDIEGKVLEVRKRDKKVVVEECQMEKKDGSTFYLPISPNNLVITKFGGKKLDPWREKMMNRKEKDYGEEPLEAPLKKKGGK